MSSAFYDIQYKASAGQVNLDQAQGIVECFVAGIGNKDSVGDVCATGAFTKSLMRRKPRVVWGHNWNDPIGKVLEIYEVPPSDPRLPSKMRSAGIGGLYAKVQFNLNSEKGREAFANVAFFGEEQEWSIGYKTLRAQFDQNIQANILYEVELYEVSPVLHGANQLTGTISVKSDEKGGMMMTMPQPVMKPSDEEYEMQQEMERKLQDELSTRLGTPVKVLKMEDGVVYFSRDGESNEDSKYKCRYHRGDDGVFMFGRPERFMQPRQEMTPMAKPPARMPMGMPSKPMAPAPGSPPVVVPGLVPGASPSSPPMVRFNFENDGKPSDAAQGNAKLVAEERDLAEALVKITKRYGKFNEDSTGVWAGYKPAAENPVAKIGVKCANCVMFQGDGKCKIIDKQVEPEGKCRFAIIPEGVVSMGPVQKMNYDMDIEEEEVKWLEDIEAKYPGEFLSGTLRSAVKRRRKRRLMNKKVFRIDEYQEKSFDDFSEIDLLDISYVLPVHSEDAFEIKQLLDPIIDYHMVDATVEEGGILFSGGITKDFVEAVGAAVFDPFLGIEEKALGRRNLAGRAIRRTRGLLARFDPNAWDGDNDGIVQEGTRFERPATPGVNDYASRGKVNAARAREAWDEYKDSGKPKVEKRTNPNRTLSDSVSEMEDRELRKEARKLSKYVDKNPDDQDSAELLRAYNKELENRGLAEAPERPARTLSDYSDRELRKYERDLQRAYDKTEDGSKDERDIGELLLAAQREKRSRSESSDTGLSSGSRLSPPRAINPTAERLDESINKEDYDWGIDNIIEDFGQYLDELDPDELRDVYDELLSQMRMDRMKARRDGILEDDVMGDDFGATALRLANELNLDDVDAEDEAGRLFDARDRFKVREEQYKAAVKNTKRRLRAEGIDINQEEGEKPSREISSGARKLTPDTVGAASRRERRKQELARRRPKDGIIEERTRAGKNQSIKDKGRIGLEKFDMDTGLSSGSRMNEEEILDLFEERSNRGPRPLGDELAYGFREDLDYGKAEGNDRSFIKDYGTGRLVINYQDEQLDNILFRVVDPQNMEEDLGESWYMNDMAKESPRSQRPGWYLNRLVLDSYDGYYDDEYDYDFSYAVGPFDSPEAAAEHWETEGLERDKRNNKPRAFEVKEKGPDPSDFALSDDPDEREIAWAEYFSSRETGLSSGGRKYPPRYESSKKLADLMGRKKKPRRSNYDYSQDSEIEPTEEQKDIIDAVMQGADVVVGALAGSGKTSTLVSLARRLKREDKNKKVIYLAFNKSAAQDARRRFKGTPVQVMTMDAMAYNWYIGRGKKNADHIKKRFNLNKEGNIGTPTSRRAIAQKFGVKEYVYTNANGDEVTVSNEDIAKMAIDAVERYETSSDEEIGLQHFGLGKGTSFKQLAESEIPPTALALAKRIWESKLDVDDKNGVQPSNATLTKLMALADPNLSDGSITGRGVDLAMIDEAQDLNPVFSSFIRGQDVQKVTVGDPNQAIYGFRGAKNEMDVMGEAADYVLPLTEVFRFGPEIATAGNKVLSLFNIIRGRMIGRGKEGLIIDPPGSMEDAGMILARTNAGVVREAMAELAKGRIVGTTERAYDDLESFIDSWKYIIGATKKRPSNMHPELAEYDNIQQIMDDISKGTASQKTKTLFNLGSTYKVAELEKLLGSMYIWNPSDEDGENLEIEYPESFEPGDLGVIGTASYEITDDEIVLGEGSYDILPYLKSVGFVGSDFDRATKTWRKKATTPAERERILTSIADALNNGVSGSIDIPDSLNNGDSGNIGKVQWEVRRGQLVVTNTPYDKSLRAKMEAQGWVLRPGDKKDSKGKPIWEYRIALSGDQKEDRDTFEIMTGLVAPSEGSLPRFAQSVIRAADEEIVQRAKEALASMNPNDKEAEYLSNVLDAYERNGWARRRGWERMERAAKRKREVPPIDVRVLTAHLSKGLESDKVKLASDYWGPKVNDDGELEWPDEEHMKVIYVALTRAKKMLDPGSAAWIFQYTDDDDGFPDDPNAANYEGDNDTGLSSGNRRARRARTYNGREVSGQPKINRRPWSEEERQAFRDGVRTRAQTIPGKRRGDQAPGGDDTGLSSGGRMSSDERVYNARMGGMSLDDAAEQFGMTRAEVRQAESRHSSRMRGGTGGRSPSSAMLDENIYKARVGGMTLDEAAEEFGLDRFEIRQAESRHSSRMRNRDSGTGLSSGGRSAESPQGEDDAVSDAVIEETETAVREARVEEAAGRRARADFGLESPEESINRRIEEIQDALDRIAESGSDVDNQEPGLRQELRSARRQLASLSRLSANDRQAEETISARGSSSDGGSSQSYSYDDPEVRTRGVSNAGGGAIEGARKEEVESVGFGIKTPNFEARNQYDAERKKAFSDYRQMLRDNDMEEQAKNISESEWAQSVDFPSYEEWASSKNIPLTTIEPPKSISEKRSGWLESSWSKAKKSIGKLSSNETRNNSDEEAPWYLDTSKLRNLFKSNTGEQMSDSDIAKVLGVKENEVSSWDNPDSGITREAVLDILERRDAAYGKVAYPGQNESEIEDIWGFDAAPIRAIFLSGENGGGEFRILNRDEYQRLTDDGGAVSQFTANPNISEESSQIAEEAVQKQRTRSGAKRTAETSSRGNFPVTFLARSLGWIGENDTIDDKEAKDKIYERLSEIANVPRKTFDDWLNIGMTSEFVEELIDRGIVPGYASVARPDIAEELRKLPSPDKARLSVEKFLKESGVPDKKVGPIFDYVFSPPGGRTYSNLYTQHTKKQNNRAERRASDKIVLSGAGGKGNANRVTISEEEADQYVSRLNERLEKLGVNPATREQVFGSGDSTGLSSGGRSSGRSTGSRKRKVTAADISGMVNIGTNNGKTSGAATEEELRDKNVGDMQISRLKNALRARERIADEFPQIADDFDMTIDDFPARSGIDKPEEAVDSIKKLDNYINSIVDQVNQMEVMQVDEENKIRLQEESKARIQSMLDSLDGNEMSGIDTGLRQSLEENMRKAEEMIKASRQRINENFAPLASRRDEVQKLLNELMGFSRNRGIPNARRIKGARAAANKRLVSW